jgi:hypothetical protein
LAAKPGQTNAGAGKRDANSRGRRGEGGRKVPGSENGSSRRTPRRPLPPRDPIAEAMDGSWGWGSPEFGVSAEEWERVRAKTWRLWHKLVLKPPAPEELARARAAAPYEVVSPPARDSESAWPPEAARHDGIDGRALHTLWPAGRAAEVCEAAEEDLRALDLFRAAHPAAKEIAGPLATYERLLAEILGDPELRLLDG